MAYSVALLTSEADCDALITIATVERGDLDYKRLTIERKQTNSTTTATTIETDIATVTAEISTYDGMLLTLPEGPTRVEILDKKVRAEYRLYTLNARKASTGGRAVLQNEYDIACIDKDILENDQFLIALNARKAEL